MIAQYKNNRKLALLGLIIIILSMACKSTNNLTTEILPNSTAIESTDLPQQISAPTVTVDIVEPTRLSEQPSATVEAPTAVPYEVISQTWPKDGMTMVLVPAGEFLMGSPEEYGFKNEHPQHTVYLDAFWIDQTEVTNEMFRAFVDDSNYQTDAEKAGQSQVQDPGKVVWRLVDGANWKHPTGPSLPSPIKENIQSPICPGLMRRHTVCGLENGFQRRQSGKKLPKERMAENTRGDIKSLMLLWQTMGI